MILPIYAFGQPVLKKTTEEISPDFPGLAELVSNMFETMYHADGVGLAAPQIGLSIRLFVVDTAKALATEETNEAEKKGIKKVFINARILEEQGEMEAYEEGCLSIPDIRGDVDRCPHIHLRWMDEDFQEREAEFDGINARVIQHEYDHTEGRLFTDLLKPVRRQLIKGKLEKIKKGQVKVSYPMRFSSR